MQNGLRGMDIIRPKNRLLSPAAICPYPTPPTRSNKGLFSQIYFLSSSHLKAAKTSHFRSKFKSENMNLQVYPLSLIITHGVTVKVPWHPINTKQ